MMANVKNPLRTTLTVDTAAVTYEPDTLQDVRWWFAQNPRACCTNRKARRMLREYDSTRRPWLPGLAAAGQSLAEKLMAHHRARWWKDLRDRLIQEDIDVPRSRANEFADYIAGYLLVCQGEQQKSDTQKLRRVTPHWRRARRSLKDLGADAFSLASSHYPGSKSLKTSLIELMCESLNSARSLTPTDAAKIVSNVFVLIEESPEPLSVARIARRSRRGQRCPQAL